MIKLNWSMLISMKLNWNTLPAASGALSSSHFLELTMDLCIYKKHSLQGITRNKEKQ